MKTMFATKPERIMYMPLKNDYADVWLRKEIKFVENEEGQYYTAEEKYVKVKMTYEEVEENFEKLFKDEKPKALEEQVEELEQIIKEQDEALIELANIVGGMLE